MMHVWSADRREVWYGFGDWCAICWSELTRGLPEVRGPMACLTCLRIDAGLATAHGARLMTPLDPLWGRDADVLLHRLRPDDGAARERMDAHRYKGMLRLLAEADAARGPAAPRIALRYPGSGYRVFDRGPWQLLHPPGPAASARAYVRYAEEVHSWMAGVDPRVADDDALLTLLKT